MRKTKNNEEIGQMKGRLASPVLAKRNKRGQNKYWNVLKLPCTVFSAPVELYTAFSGPIRSGQKRGQESDAIKGASNREML